MYSGNYKFQLKIGRSCLSVWSKVLIELGTDLSVGNFVFESGLGSLCEFFFFQLPIILLEYLPTYLPHLFIYLLTYT